MDEETLLATIRRRQRLGRLVGGLAAALGLAGLTLLFTGLARRPRGAPPPEPVAPIEAPPPVDPAEGYTPGARRRRLAVFAATPDDHAFDRKPTPQPGEWLFTFREPGQTVAEHARDCRNRRTAERHTLHLLPYTDLTDVDRAVLPALREFVEIYFGVDAVILPTRELPRAAWSATREQWHAEALADAQLGAVPPDSLGVLGLVGGDMYVDQLNFVFGIGRFEERVGVHSLHRFGDEPRRLKRRALLLTAHELGHMFGLRHCVFYACAMNGTNSLAESDRQPLHLCPVCREKLRHALGFEHVERYRRLADFYTRQGMGSDAAFARSQAEAVTAQAGRTPTARP